MIAKETINGLMLEAEQTIEGIPQVYNHNRAVLIDPEFLIAFCNEYTGLKFDNDIMKQQISAIKEVIGS